jgi:hypothetical protein
VPALSAASTISVAAFSFTEPAKLKPSHFRNNDCPTIARRSTNSSSSLNPCGTLMIGISAAPLVS